MKHILGYLVATIIVFTKSIIVMEAADVNSLSKYEEYIVEHEISTTQARNQALAMNLDDSK